MADAHKEDRVEEQTMAPGDEMAANPVDYVPPEVAPTPAVAAPEVAQPIEEAPESASPEPAPAIDVAPAAPVKPAAVNGIPVPPTAQDLDAEHIQLAKDFASKAIVPETYQKLFADKSTTGKVMTLFGLLVGGAGSGLTGQPNAVLQMMDKTIANDLEAQKSSKSNALNWLNTAYAHEVQKADVALKQGQLSQLPLSTEGIRLQNEGTKADNALKAQNNAINGMKIGLMQDMQNVVDKSPPSVQPIAQDKLNNVVKPAVMQSIQQANQQTAAQLNAKFIARQQQLRLLGMGDIAQSNEARDVPGVGSAAVPVTSEDRGQILAAQNFNNKINKYEEFVKKTTALQKLNPAVINEGKVLSAELQTAFRQATNGGVYKEGEKNYIDSIIPSDPTKFFGDIRVMPQIQAIREDANDRYNNLLQSKGLPAQKVQTEKTADKTAQVSGPQEGSTATSKSGKPMVFTKGSWRYK